MDLKILIGENAVITAVYCSRGSRFAAVKGARVLLGEERYLCRETDCGLGGLSVCYSFENGTNSLNILLGTTEQR